MLRVERQLEALALHCLMSPAEEMVGVRMVRDVMRALALFRTVRREEGGEWGV